MKELTRAEEQIMQVLWDLNTAFVNDILEQLPEPRPAYNTVSTIVRILEKKGFVGHKAFGKSHQYHPLIKKKEYTRHVFKGMLSGYFGNSMRQMVSFFAREKNLSIQELEEIKQIIDSEINQKEDQ